MINIKKGQAAFEDIFMVMAYLFFAGLLFFIVYFAWGQISAPLGTALNSVLPANAPMNVTHSLNQTAGGLGLFNGLYPFLLIGLIVMLIVSASFMNSHPAFFFVSLIILIVAVILGVVYSNVFGEITTNAEFGDTADHFTITSVFMKYLPFVLVVIIVIVFVVMFSQTGGKTGGGV